MKDFYHRYKTVVNWGVKLAITAGFMFALFYQLKSRNNILTAYQNLNEFQVSSKGWVLLCSVWMLMAFNWFLEAGKWRYIISGVYPIKLRRAFGSVLAGLALSMFTPNRIGEFAGRVVLLKTDKKLKITLLTVVCTYSQTLAVMVFGLAGILFFMWRYYNMDQAIWWSIAFLSVAFIAILFTIYFNIGIIHLFLQKFRLFKKFERITSILQRLETGKLWNVFFFSVVRYLVFATQYLMLLLAFEVPVSLFEGFMIISGIFFVQTVLPTIAIAEVLKRVTLALSLFGFMPFFVNATNDMQTVYEGRILMAATGLWLINLVIPSIIGLLILLKANIANAMRKWTD